VRLLGVCNWMQKSDAQGTAKEIKLWQE